MLKVATSFGSGRGWGEAVSWVLEAEKLGVDSVWTSEAWGFDAISPLAYLAGKTVSVSSLATWYWRERRPPASM